MPIQLNEDKSKNRPEDLKRYERLKHTTEEQQYLRSRGFVPVVSSNVSAVARDVEKLIIRFHGGATYVYPNSGDKFDAMMSASSKGRFVWRELVKKKVAYYRTGSYNIPDDVESRDMMRPKTDTDVTIADTMTKQARATTVNVKQASGSETIIDIRDIPQVRRPKGLDVALLSNDDALAQGIIASVLLAQMINNSEEEDAEKRR